MFNLVSVDLIVICFQIFYYTSDNRHLFIFSTMKQQMVFRTPFNYIEVQRTHFHSPIVFMDRQVRIADTDIKQDSASFADLSSAPEGALYTNSEVPIKVFGNGILSTPFNPLTQKQHKAEDSQAAMSPTQQSNPAPAESPAAAVVTQ